MDSLFDTINVRDLLPTQDLSDPTSPLSAPDLRLLIQRLESHSLQIKSKIQELLVKFMENTVQFDGKSNQFEVKYKLRAGDVDEMLLQTVLEAMGEHLLPEFFLDKMFWKIDMARISELIISSFPSKVVPTDASKLPDFQKIIKFTPEFVYRIA